MVNLFQKLWSIYDCTNLNIIVRSALARILCSCASFQIWLPLHAHSTLSELCKTSVVRCNFRACSALATYIRRCVTLVRGQTSCVSELLVLLHRRLGKAWVVFESVGTVLRGVCKLVYPRNNSVRLRVVLLISRRLVARNHLCSQVRSGLLSLLSEDVLALPYHSSVNSALRD